ncbi:hypothetical protein SAMN05443633_101115 [Chryseobacterium arachidis]|uniref:Tetratricopeptide repeat-containing protein n=1 Tax=Chryseobacterium arachidis TaxID=1416778 RepID=A0A1M4SZW7_9FLAO|nr:hypothetical protein [Chryseobacterium arachidis]SHE37724.1 hypothetical protein SAMN05443633_101115 [Chryseobacterium arachidis]
MKTILSFVLLLISSVAFGQNTPISKRRFKTLVSEAYQQFSLKEYDDAKKSYLEILKFVDENKVKKFSGKTEYYTSNSYINGFYTNLAKIELINKNYSEAIKYLDKKKEYPFRATCGNANARIDISMATLYSQCYIGLEKDEEALNFLIPYILDNQLGNNSEIVHLTYNLLSKNHSSENLKHQFEDSFKSLNIKKEKRNQYEYDAFSIRFLNRDIPLENWDFRDLKTQEEKEKLLREILFKSEFYTLLSK